MDRALLPKPPRDLIRLFFEASSEGFQRKVCSVVWNSTDIGNLAAKCTEHLFHDGILLRFFSQWRFSCCSISSFDKGPSSFWVFTMMRTPVSRPRTSKH